jgi:hypothetical protein
MGTNGQRKPPRPSLTIVAPGASEEEAAAISAGIERFIAETTPTPAASSRSANPWQRAALLEGVGRTQPAPSPWGGSAPW